MNKYGFALFLCTFLWTNTLSAQQNEVLLKEKGFLIGMGRASLDQKRDYQIIPLSLKLGFSLKPLLKIKGLLELELEPFISGVISPDNNLEFGCGLLFKYGYKIKKFLPYLEVGSGILYTTQHTREQSTQYNFMVQAGAGLYYFLKEGFALNVGYRFRHFSNASLKEPNDGIDVHTLLCGYSLFY